MYSDGDVNDGDYDYYVNWDSCGRSSPNFNYDGNAYAVHGSGYVNIDYVVDWKDSCGNPLSDAK